ncbi:Mevalonate kinase [Ascosphaera pollenicola]|nr:Mevalonate kinase [Ascosphaera pollenicola]
MSAPKNTGRPPLRGRPSFLARAAVPAAIESAEPQDGPGAAHSDSDVYHVSTDRPYAPYVSTSPQSLHHRLTPPGRGRPTINNDRQKAKSAVRDVEAPAQQHENLPRRRLSLGRSQSLSVPVLNSTVKKPLATPPAHSAKLGTFSGVFVPTTLNVLSILMFLRFGFILAHGGVIGMMGMLIASYLINLVTTMSISAIATNGTVRGGGAYYLISRSLGPEFGGSIGIVFYLGFVFNTGMNAVGLIDCITQNFGALTGTWSRLVPEGFWLEYLYSTSVLVLCTVICLAGSSMFARASNGLLFILLISTFSIPFSAIFMKPFANDALGIEFTGFSMKTFKDNMFPRLAQGTRGDEVLGRETLQNLFGILFPATGGIFAGASMSGDLRNPSKSIPKGTLYGLVLTFFTYAIVILAMAATITRDSFYVDANIIQDVSLSEVLILLGEFSTSFFSSLMGVIGSAKLLQAIARDSLIPGLSIFSQGSGEDEPTNAIIFTFVVAQLTMLFDINRIASFITMTYLMTFLVVNLACFLLKIGSAPNFRPSFHYFNSWTAFIGTVVSGLAMFYVDGVFASGSVIVLVSLFMLIHYTSPPKSWGDVSQSLIYHQVRKYLLRLKPEHVKFWRPQILLFVKDYEKQSKIISFCNSLKKGGLFVLTRIIVAKDFASTVPLVRKEQAAWSKFIGFSRVKAFMNISVAPNAEWGVRSVILNSGLGGMRPNIVVIPHIDDEPLSPDLQENQNNETITGNGEGVDTNNARTAHEKAVRSYLTILEDLLFKLRINVAVARGFEKLELPAGKHGLNTKKYIDLWPIQMSAEITADGTENKQNILTTNFDTYTLILQLGCILHTVPSWKLSYKLRINVFVEYESDVDEEYGRVKTLLDKLRIEAEICVYWLASGDVRSYDYIINGSKSDTDQATIDHVEKVLKSENWWHEILKLRRSGPDSVRVAKFLKDAETWPPNFSPGPGRRRASTQRFHGLRQLVDSPRRSTTGLSISHSMQTHNLLESMVHTPSDGSSDDSDSFEEFEPYTDIVTHQQSSDRTSPRSAGAISALDLLEDVPALLSVPKPSESTHTAGRARSKSPSRFVSTPMPDTRVEESEDAQGPSIMFVDDAPARAAEEHRRQNCGQPASGFPSQASVALSFNDLPSRAQHLILNELIKSHSDQTAVVFTTLPSPVEATFQDYSASESYIEDLRVFCDGLPACLLVHSNSMTVTMNL